MVGTYNRLASAGNYTYSYDASGNLSQRSGDGNTVTYTWDHRNRLTRVAYAAGKVVDYVYDMFDRRIVKRVDNPGAVADTEDRYVYDGQHLFLQFDRNNALTHHYVHGPAVDQLLADEAVGQDWRFPLADNLNSVRDVVSSTGTNLNHTSYDPFGKIDPATAAKAVDFLFGYNGRESDPETGLSYYRGRYYDPATGRFLSEDPIDLASGDGNLYRYVGNDPLNYVDPSGLIRLFGQEFVAPWSQDASWSIGDNLAVRGAAAWTATAGIVSGAASGAAVGSSVGGVIGAGVGSVAGGVGAGPGFLAGAGVGATSGAIGGGISGLISSIFSDGAKDAAWDGAVSGALSGVFSGVGAGAGVFAKGGTQALTHFSTEAGAESIKASQVLGKATNHGLFATTGTAAGTTTGSNVPVLISGQAAKQFASPTPFGIATSYASTAGWQIGPSGRVSLETGARLAGTWSVNLSFATLQALDTALNVGAGYFAPYYFSGSRSSTTSPLIGPSGTLGMGGNRNGYGGNYSYGFGYGRNSNYGSLYSNTTTTTGFGYGVGYGYGTNYGFSSGWSGSLNSAFNVSTLSIGASRDK